MMGQHTKGPWEVLTGPSPDGWYQVGETHGGRLVQVMPYYCGDTQANARLIAAAPDLLEALDRALAAMIQSEKSDNSGGEYGAVCPVCAWIGVGRHAPDCILALSITIARAAIAKATGVAVEARP